MIDSIISSIEGYVSKNEEQIYEIERNRNKDKDMVLNSQKIVRQFIIDRKLIIFGGLAIDYALRLKGSSIYYFDDIPDYDCISDRNVDDAYDLGEILNNAGFENVKVIRAKHVETMRVRINFITVADIGYIPSKYFKQYKYLMYNQLRIIHPDVQRIDLHRAFCFPLNNAPMEDIFNRWEKDLYRFNLFEQHYPIKESNSDYTYYDMEYIIPDIDYALHGFSAFALFSKELLKHGKLTDVDIKITKNKCKVSSPIKTNLHIVTGSNIEKVIENYSKSDVSTDDKINIAERFHTILGLIPDSVVIGNVTIYQVNLLSVVKINNIKVVTIQYLLLWFLFNYHFNDIIQDRPIYGNFYVYTLKMIELSNTVYKDTYNPFNPSLTFIGESKPFEPIVQNDKYPVNYTPSREGTRQIFDYNNFQISGEKY